MTEEFFNSITPLLRYKTYSSLVEDIYISSLVESFERLKAVPGIADMTENHIRNHLAFDLENHNTLLYPFFQTKLLKLTKENTLLLSPEETKRTDIEFFISGAGDFVVECKKLQSADQRYISEGINRFVTKVYARSAQEAGLLGFVVGGKCASVMAGLRTRIGNERSFDKEYIHPTKTCGAYKFSFHSLHKRESIAAILLHHLFVDLVHAVDN
jgi:hypothetical protein